MDPRTTDSLLSEPADPRIDSAKGWLIVLATFVASAVTLGTVYSFGAFFDAMAEDFDVEMVISLGALIADVTHSRPATVYSAAYDLELIERLAALVTR